MDALPVNEETGAEFASEVGGYMHACGHDVHTAALLGAASVLYEHRNELQGNVIFLFEPDEEGDGGAARMIDAGCLEGADAVFGAHVDPSLPEGTAGIRYGKFYAAADTFDVEVRGESSHGAERWNGKDALESAARMVTELIRLPESISQDGCVLTVGKFRSGSARNIMPGRASFSGMIRTLGADTRSDVKEGLFETVERISRDTGTKSEIKLMSRYPGIVNDDKMTDIAANAASKLLGSSNVQLIDQPTMKTEDFGCFSNVVPGSFYHIGAGCTVPLHNEKFLPTEKALLTAAAMHVAVAYEYLNGDL